jgi:formate/nitrite transporter FocA (FNT family)
MLQEFSTVEVTTTALSVSGMVSNIIPVLLGNIIGGSVLVGLMYHFIFLRNKRK